MPRLSKPLIAVIAVFSLILLHSLFTGKITSSTNSRPIPQSFKSNLKDTHSPLLKHTSPFRSSSRHQTPAHLAALHDLEIDHRGYTAYSPSDTKHPIERLMERAKKQVKALESRINQVETLDDAVEEYETSYGMAPPKGFEDWYKFTRRGPEPKPVPVAGLFPFAHNPILPHLSISGEEMRKRTDEIEDHGNIFTFTLVPDGQGDKGTACTVDQTWKPEDWNTRGKGMVKVGGKGSWGFRSK
jgi:beta-1,2-xylosyltransferase